MSVTTELSRIQTDRNTIRAKLVEMGLANGTDNLTALAEAISEIIDRGAVSVNVKEGETYTIPQGWHNGAGTVSGVAGGGNYNLQSKNVTPTKKQQSITADDGYYGMSDVTVAPIPDNYQDVSSVNAAAGEVLSGKIIVLPDGTIVTGTMANNGAVSKTLDVTVVSYTIPQGYHNGNGMVTITLETKTVTPTKGTQTITPTAGKLLSSVTVEPIPTAFQDVTQVTATAPTTLSGYKIVDKTGDVIDGTMPNNGELAGTIDGLAETSFAVPAGYTSGGTVSLTSDIEEALAAI